MSYGVNKTWQSGAGRARGAAKRKGSARKRAKKSTRGSSARRARKKSGTSSRKTTRPRGTRAKKAAKRKSAAPRAKRAKKARTYVRYTETGQRIKVTKDDPRYLSLTNRKPSKRAKLQAQIISDPGSYVAKRAKAAGTRAAEHAVANVVRKYGPGAVETALGTAAAIGTAGLVAIAGAAAAALGAQLLVSAAREGAQEHALSLQFVNAQKELIARSGVRTWQQVPEAARTRLLGDFKRGLARIAEVRKATSISTTFRNRKG